LAEWRRRTVLAAQMSAGWVPLAHPRTISALLDDKRPVTLTFTVPFGPVSRHTPKAWLRSRKTRQSCGLNQVDAAVDGVERDLQRRIALRQQRKHRTDVLAAEPKTGRHAQRAARVEPAPGDRLAHVIDTLEDLLR
jgi:hypothetical protein